MLGGEKSIFVCQALQTDMKALIQGDRSAFLLVPKASSACGIGPPGRKQLHPLPSITITRTSRRQLIGGLPLCGKRRR